MTIFLNRNVIQLQERYRENNLEDVLRVFSRYSGIHGLRISTYKNHHTLISLDKIFDHFKGYGPVYLLLNKVLDSLEKEHLLRKELDKATVYNNLRKRLAEIKREHFPDKNFLPPPEVLLSANTVRIDFPPSKRIKATPLK